MEISLRSKEAMMILRKSKEKTEILSESPRTVQRKTSRSFLRVHDLNSSTIVITCIITLLILSTEANSQYRPHRPHPGQPILKPMPLPEVPSDAVFFTTSDKGDEVAIVENSSSATVPTPSTTVDVIDEDAETDDNNEYEDFPDHDVEINEDLIEDDDENNVQNYPNDADPEQLDTPKTPQEELNQMVEGLDSLLSNESAVVTINDVSEAFDQMDILLSTEDEELEFPCVVLNALDALGARADLNGSSMVAETRRNVAVVMADSAPERPVRGLRIAAGDFTNDALQILQDDVDPTTLTSYDTEAVVNLPGSLADKSRRISFVVFRSDRAFTRHDSDHYEVNSKIISVRVENFTQMENGEVIDIHLKPSIYEPPRNMTRACAYWHFAENGTGYWSQEGCIFIKASAGLLDMCRCTHLTHFAEVLIPKLVFSEDNETALEIISLTGCFLSLFGLIIIGLTAIVFRSWRNDFNNKIWLQLTVALLINVISFLIIVFSKFEHYSIFCMIVGVLLHYAVLASFCWMLVAGIISYRKLVMVFARDPRRRLLKASVFCWLAPFVVVSILLMVAPHSYTRRFGGETPTGGFCYPSDLGLWLTVIAPIAIVVGTNWIIFALIIRSVFGTKNIEKHGDSSEMIRRASVSCLLVFLFGLPWVFGLFAYNIVAAYLFTLTTSYQGFVLFIFFVVINTKTRGMWLNKLRIKKKTNVVSSSFISSRNAPASNEQSPFLEPSFTRTNITSLLSNSSDGKAVAYNIPSGSAVIEDSHYTSKDSDIDSFITAKSHDNFSEDEIFKSIEGITDIIDDAEANNVIKTDSMPDINTNSDDTSHSNKRDITLEKDVSDCEAAEDLITPKTDHIVSSSISVAKLNNVDTSNRNNVSDHSSQEVESEDETVSAEITLYSVPTQNASLIS